MNNKKPCVACGNNIPLSAKLCAGCSTYQSGVLSYFSISNTVLALILAIISVTAAVGPQIKELFAAKDSALDGEFLSFRRERAVFQVRNSGTVAGSITGGWVAFSTGPNGSTTRFPLSVGNDDQSIVQPNDVKVVDIRSEGADTELLKAAFVVSTSDKCEVILVGRNFKGATFMVNTSALCIQAINSLFPEDAQAIIKAKFP